MPYLAFIAILVSFLMTSMAHGQWSIRVDAGDHDRLLTPVSVVLPDAVDHRDQTVVLVEAQDNQRVPAQIDPRQPTRIWWLESISAGTQRTYRITLLDEADQASQQTVSVADNGQALVLANRGRPVLHYQHVTMASPVKDKPFHARSGFIHPVLTPAGKVLTDPMPADHLHQHGIMFAWRNTEFEGRSVNFWEDAAREGRISHSEIIDQCSGPVFGQFAVRIRHTDLTAPEGDKDVLSEVWRVRAYGTQQDFVWDLESTQTAASSSPLHMKQFHYGGFMIRGSAEWMSSPHRILTSNGDGRFQGNHTRPLWVDINGAVQGDHVGLTTMGHPNNFRFPQPVRLHPSMPYYCFAPMVTAAFDIVPGQPFQSRFRFVAHDGPLDRSRAVSYWRDWASPPRVTILSTDAR